MISMSDVRCDHQLLQLFIFSDRVMLPFQVIGIIYSSCHNAVLDKCTVISYASTFTVQYVVTLPTVVP